MNQMDNINSKLGVDRVNIQTREDGILRVTIGVSLDEEDVEKLINDAINLSKKTTERTRVLVNFEAAPHIPSFIFRKQIVKSIKRMLAEIKNWKIAVYGGGTIQKTVASFIASASGLGEIRFLENKKDALNWLNEEK